MSPYSPLARLERFARRGNNRAVERVAMRVRDDARCERRCGNSIVRTFMSSPSTANENGNLRAGEDLRRLAAEERCRGEFAPVRCHDDQLAAMAARYAQD